MPEYLERSGFLGWRRQVGWFIGLELLCVVGSAVLLAIGQPRLAVAVLAGPFQLLAWCALAGNGRALLIAFAALVPLAGAYLLPYAYYGYVLLPGTIGLLALLQVSRGVFGDLPISARIRTSERMSMLVLSVWAIASGIQAASRGWGTQYLLLNTLLVVEVMFVTYFAAVIPRSLQTVRVLLYVVIASETVVALWVPMASLASGGPGSKAVSTPFGETNLNIVACGLATVGATALGLVTSTKRFAPKFLLSAAVLLCTVALVVTRSRGAWMGFAIAVLYILVRTRSLGLMFLVAVAGLGLTMSDLLRSMLVSRAADTSATDPSMFGRFVLWYFAWRISKANLLLGVGMDNFRYVKHFYGYPVPWALARAFNAHNLYLEVLADLGVVGFVTFFFLSGKAVVSSWRAMRHGTARDLGLGLSAGFIACAVHGLVESVMFNPGIFALLGVLVGLALSLNRLTAGPVSAMSVHTPYAGRPASQNAGLD
jgi:O-antigen ligase